ncbi:MAG: hypothetical protein ACXVB9_09950, partial [Bdellovibrionota bacterium]
MDEPKKQIEYKIVKAFNCAVAQIDGQLHICRLLRSGELQVHMNGANWTKVGPPVGQNFLNAVNAALGSSYQEGDFRIEKSKRAGLET